MLACLGGTPVTAKEAFEGVWARARSECADRDTPTSRTLIELSNRLNGKRTPIFDQYENHCRVDGVERHRAAFALAMRCFEFTDDYMAQRNGAKRVVSVVRRGTDLLIDGRLYRLCKDISFSGKGR